MLLSTHHILAAALQTPELALQKAEAKGLADALAEVSSHYPMAIDPKTMAWVNLATCVGITYGPRVYMIRKRMEADSAAKMRRATHAPTPEAQAAADAHAQATGFIVPGMTGAMGPVSDASSM